MSPPLRQHREGDFMSLYEILSTIDGFLWGNPYLFSLMGIGAIIVIMSKGFVFRHFGHIMKNTLGSLTSKEARDKNEGKSVSPFEAVCVALGCCVGTGNISGVAAAIAVGGPGALFWMWVWAFFGMTVKLAEATLGSYYRKKTGDGEYVGGPYYYMAEGIGNDKGWKIGFALAGLFSFGFVAMFLSGSQAGPIAETLHASFGIPMMPFTILFCIFVAYTLWKGIPHLAKVASKIVPWMCILYLCMGIIIIFKNIGNVPAAIVSIFEGAFTGTAATGGFVGATVATTIRTGVARAVDSNEAGMGTSPMIYARTKTAHPVRAGLWGVFEVFVDTMVVCSVTGLSCLVTGLWSSGDTAMTLAISVFRHEFGGIGVVMICFMMLLFGFTTATSALGYYDAALQYLLRKWPSLSKRASMIFKIVFGLPNIFIVATINYTGSDFNLYWEFVNIIIWFPVLWNVIALLILSPKFVELTKDYEARYLHKGTVKADAKLFYATEPDREIGE